MTHPPDCPAFEYAQHPRRQQVLSGKTAELVRKLRSRTLDSQQLAADSRPAHGELFKQLAPSGYQYYAGHYRGEPFRYLKEYAVTIPSDPRVGLAPAGVPTAMGLLAREILAGLAALDSVHARPRSHVPSVEKLYYTVVFACRVLEVLLRFHPYANGNGHAARFVVWAILGRYGYWPKRWPIDPRPPDPPYTSLIVEYRNGNHEPLERFMLASLRH